MKRIDAVLGKVNLPSWCFIVLRHGGHAHRRIYCLLPLRRVAADFYPLSHKHVFQGLAGWYLVYMLSAPCDTFSSMGLSSAGLAPLSPYSRKILNETVKTFAVFLSWMHLLDGEDNCMLYVPFCSSDPHISYWQSSDICQVVATGAFTLLGSNFWFALKGGCSPYFSVLLSCQRVVCSMFPVF